MYEIMIVSKPNCVHCDELKTLLADIGYAYDEVNMMDLSIEEQQDLRATARANRQTSMPLVFIDGQFTKTDDFERWLKG